VLINLGNSAMIQLVDDMPQASSEDTRIELAIHEDGSESAYLPVLSGELQRGLSANPGCPDDLAEAALQSISMLLPEARCVIAQVSDDQRHASVIAADSRLETGKGDVLTVHQKSPLRAARATTDIVHAALSGQLRQCLPWCTNIGKERQLVTCLALPQLSAGAVIMVFHTSASGHLVDNALGSLAVLVSDSRLADEADPGLYALIGKAKREWERAVDALDEVVLLVDNRGVVLRANREVERWNLGRVSDLRGVTAHSVLHMNCEEASCQLDQLLTRRWDAASENAPASTELFDEQLGKNLRITLQPIADPDSPGDSLTSFGVVVVKDVTELSAVQRELRKLNDELEQRVEMRTDELRESNADLRKEITRRKTAELDLISSRDELARLSERLLDAQESERRRIALELHDSIGQSLGALKYSLERYVAIHKDPERSDSDEILADMVTQLQRAINDTRSISMSLRPSLLDDMGAVSAVSWLCRSFSETYVDHSITLDCPTADAEIPERLAAPVFRVIQEALNNAVKHADAHSVSVRLRRRGSRLALEVRDDGVGFDMERAKQPTARGLGLLGMRERVTMTGGKFSLLSRPSAGTRVLAEWPIVTSTLPATLPHAPATTVN
jgi:signal transduction histidine kinase